MNGADNGGETGALKARLRRQLLAARERLTQAERGALSLAAVGSITASAEYKGADTILIYRAVGAELNLKALEIAAAADGKRLAYPRCASGGLLALIPRDRAAWSTGSYGIPEPEPARSELVEPRDIDLIICPCTAFDASCARLGMGGGYFDRFLPQCQSAVKAAAAFEVQRLASIPREPWDIPMDLVFTESAVYRREG